MKPQKKMTRRKKKTKQKKIDHKENSNEEIDTKRAEANSRDQSITIDLHNKKDNEYKQNKENDEAYAISRSPNPISDLLNKANENKSTIIHNPINNTKGTEIKVKSRNNQENQNNEFNEITQKVEDKISTKAIVLEDTNKASSDFICEPSSSSPLVLIIKRKTEKEIRRLINHDEIVNVTKSLCPFCEVREIELQKYDKYGQIRVTCGASLIAGVHGSGLTHAMWMKPSTEENPTALFEFLPYKYTCRHWYQQMCETFGVQYYPIYTNFLNQSRWEPGHNATKVNRCHTNDGECERGRCHDFLRDQSIIADVEQYKKDTEKFFLQLKKSYEKFKNN
ncbi:hypothetical protein M9Y10_009018 [Tritrichomonas musculus]|uniref:Glycosyltransferase 61 catalytic domain-containing protein n=1 Tax=Tritrichomonas musculus TaxID=1915356 RepID=A0ABR2J297_9EUKA